LKDFVDKHRATHGVEPICKVLQIAPSGYRRHAACQRTPELRCARARTDDTLMPQIQRVWQANMQVYGADKVWHQMNREGIKVARCTVERLMKRWGCKLQGPEIADPGRARRQARESQKQPGSCRQVKRVAPLSGKPNERRQHDDDDDDAGANQCRQVRVNALDANLGDAPSAPPVHVKDWDEAPWRTVA
jgi:hypothetical protein